MALFFTASEAQSLGSTESLESFQLVFRLGMLRVLGVSTSSFICATMPFGARVIFAFMFHVRFLLAENRFLFMQQGKEMRNIQILGSMEPNSRANILPQPSYKLIYKVSLI
jgi:hypothetical protein